MIPAFCRVKHDPEAGTYGDCVRACVATIMELDAEAVPHFFHDNCDGETGIARLREWLKGHKLVPFIMHLDGATPMNDVLAYMEDQNPHVPYMLFGRTEGGNHVVVCAHGKVAHDPSWYSTPLIGPGNGGMWSIMVLARI